MKKNTKLALLVAGAGVLAYYMYKKSKTNKVSYSGKVGDRVGFASDGYVAKGNLYNRNRRYGMTGQQTFFSKEQEQSKLLK